ncbi:hypothetical protein ALC57_16017 [Trachymyrmex cornetzi]|uniref:Uncharacterized protein n=1 Tax=Trachymyrmex cornetzi TaxID=471704 RepID=A0A195DGA6_9HYME|nr:hypothetical protein ALC57_16017 [Trachymyrmex cornetzi]
MRVGRGGEGDTPEEEGHWDARNESLQVPRRNGALGRPDRHGTKARRVPARPASQPACLGDGHFDDDDGDDDDDDDDGDDVKKEEERGGEPKGGKSDGGTEMSAKAWRKSRRRLHTTGVFERKRDVNPPLKAIVPFLSPESNLKCGCGVKTF